MACEENLRDLSFVDSIALPSNITATYDLTQDNTGVVTITPSADNAVSFDVFFGDATTDPAQLSLGENVTHTYAEGTYNLKVVAHNVKGDEVEHTQPLVVSFRAPENVMVTMENHPTISKMVNVTATADFAATYEFHSGETGVNQPVATANIGDELMYQYSNPGTYSVKIVAKGSAIATSEWTMDFEVTEILAPITAAPAPPTRDAGNVISIYTDAGYTNVDGTDTFPDWGQGGEGSSWAEFDFNGDKMLQYVNLSYQGIQFGSRQDVSGMEFLHLDVWTPESGSVANLETSLINITDTTPEVATEKPVTKALTTGEWTSLEIPIKDYTDQGLTVNEILQIKLVGDPWAAGTVFVDNIYFYKQSSASTFDDGLAVNGDFSAGSDGWIVGVDDNTPATVVNTSGNLHYSVQVPTAGNAWEVNLSQKREIVDGKTYTLTFDAWSNVSRPIIAGIGLSADPWSNDTEEVNINSTVSTYSVTVMADGWGASDARILFDMGAAAGDVNIDNVSLFEGNGNLITNGNFENGSSPWIVGVDDSVAAPTDNTDGNNHYSIAIPTAGNAWEVNLSQKLEITDGSSYILTFDAWSTVDRPIIAGIGLSADPWSNDAETVDITTNRSTYSITVMADGWGAADARVLFDLGAAAGDVNIDNVSLSKI